MSNSLLESLWARVDANIGARITQISGLLTQALAANAESIAARMVLSLRRGMRLRLRLTLARRRVMQRCRSLTRLRVKRRLSRRSLTRLPRDCYRQYASGI